MKTTDGFERFEADFYADSETAFIKHMRPATLEEQQIIQEYIEEISKPTGYNFWDAFEENGGNNV